jgi:hypothetical protein
MYLRALDETWPSESRKLSFMAAVLMVIIAENPVKAVHLGSYTFWVFFFSHLKSYPDCDLANHDLINNFLFLKK